MLYIYLQIYKIHMLVILEILYSILMVVFSISLVILLRSISMEKICKLFAFLN